MIANKYIMSNDSIDHATINRYMNNNQRVFAKLFSSTIKGLFDANVIFVDCVIVKGVKVNGYASFARSVAYVDWIITETG